MGKAQIVSAIGNGRYEIEIVRDLRRLYVSIITLQEQMVQIGIEQNKVQAEIEQILTTPINEDPEENPITDPEPEPDPDPAKEPDSDPEEIPSYDPEEEPAPDPDEEEPPGGPCYIEGIVSGLQ